MNKQTDWLLEGPEWLKYSVKKQLLQEEPDKNITVIIKEFKGLLSVINGKEKGFNALFRGDVAYEQNLYWYLFFLSDIGLSVNDFNFNKNFQKILELEDENHKFLLSKEMKPDYFCISSIILTAMVRMSEDVKNNLHPHLNTIMSAQRADGGWHCAKNRAIGNKLEKSESCLMDNLNILMLFGEYEEYKNDKRFEGAIDLLLEHWRRRHEKWRPYGFGIGSNFKKLRYPAFKYGILRVLDVLSLYPYGVKQPEVREMFDDVLKKSDNGRYKPESVSKMFKGFDFGQKKEPSQWITFLINRIENRLSSGNV